MGTYSHIELTRSHSVCTSEFVYVPVYIHMYVNICVYIYTYMYVYAGLPSEAITVVTEEGRECQDFS